MKLSIIIVAYKAEIELIRLLKSIPKKKDWEIIIVDNNKINRGFARGCNHGLKKARGEYILFLNPDCIVQKNFIQMLLKKIKSDPKIGIIGPQLLDENNQPYLNHSLQPNRLNAFIVYSFLNPIFKNTSLVKKHWFTHQSLNKSRFVGIISGAALMISKKDIQTLGGFDERFFMYWEEVDLCKQVIDKLNKKILYYPQAKIVHLQERSTVVGSFNTRHWFYQSRFKFFRKHYGWWYAETLDTWLRTAEEWRLFLILIIATFTYFNGLPTPESSQSIVHSSYLYAGIGATSTVAIYRLTEFLSTRRNAFLISLTLALTPLFLPTTMLNPINMLILALSLFTFFYTRNLSHKTPV